MPGTEPNQPRFRPSFWELLPSETHRSFDEEVERRGLFRVHAFHTTEMAESKERDEPAESVSIRSFLIELVVYAVCVVAYFFLVLHFLGGWLKDQFDHHRWVYAVVGLVIVLAQAVLLEWLTSALLRFLRSRAATK